ncbi:hypothetical protein AB0C76_23840 [Kitasatospora sp. NPDC048722]|uniref:hypothetical protein n=1 Tax=Kitasatospora sp. NPDC048722 TaxID=3155639 RepID=UPI0033C008F9
MTLARLSLASGRSIELSDVRLSSTYGGMLEGYPFRRLNDLKVQRLLKRAADEWPSVPVHLIEPVRELPDLPAGGFGAVELLPAVTCVGSFSSRPVDPGLSSVSYYSVLTVVWFQATPGVPSDDAGSGLRGLPWDSIAKDFEL